MGEAMISVLISRTGTRIQSLAEYTLNCEIKFELFISAEKKDRNCPKFPSVHI